MDTLETLFAHKHITCNLDTGGDALQLTSKESHQNRDSQDDRQEIWRTQNPACPKGTPSGSVAAMGCPRSTSSPLEPRVSQLSNTNNDEERGSKNKGKTKT